MTNDPHDPVQRDRPGRARGLISAAALLALGILLFFGGRFLYGLGQRTAARVAGLDPSASATLQPTQTPTRTVTPAFTPSPTNTIYFAPIQTPTPTKIPWSSCPGIVVTVIDTDKGDIVHILRCSDGLEYDIGPLTKGVYAIPPDDRYFVYCSLDGVVYAARIGEGTLTVIRRTHREFYTFGRDMDPIFELTFSDESPYVLEVYEKRYGQSLLVRMPRWLSD